MERVSGVESDRHDVRMARTVPRLLVDAARCTGCVSCVLACSVAHDGVYSYEGARIRIVKDAERATATPRVCIQCDAAPCIPACPVGALSRDDGTGAIYLSVNLCIHCRRCAVVCPFDGIHWNETEGIPVICDLCGGEPECVLFCRFPQAIRYGEAPREDSR